MDGITLFNEVGYINIHLQICFKLGKIPRVEVYIFDNFFNMLINLLRLFILIPPQQFKS